MGNANHAPNSTQLHPPVSKSGVRFLKFLPKNPFVGEIWAEKTFPVYSHLRHIDEKYYVFEHTASFGFIFYNCFTFFCILQAVLKVRNELPIFLLYLVHIYIIYIYIYIFKFKSFKCLYIKEN